MTQVSEAYARALQRLGHYRWFAVMIKQVFSKVDRTLYRATSGRLTVSGPALPTMLLTTVGRKTGKPRVVPVYYLRDQNNLVVGCVNSGLKAKSDWPKNLEANPVARVQNGRETRWFRARPATEDEFVRYWRQFLELWPAVQTYYERNGERYLFVLEPTTDTDPRIGASS